MVHDGTGLCGATAAPMPEAGGCATSLLTLAQQDHGAEHDAGVAQLEEGQQMHPLHRGGMRAVLDLNGLTARHDMSKFIACIRERTN